MKRSFSIMLACVLVFSACFVACSAKEDDDSTTTPTTSAQEGLAASEDEYGFETDENGNIVQVKYEKDKDGNIVAYVVGENGKKNGKTLKPNNYVSSNNDSSSGSGNQTIDPDKVPSLKGPDDIENKTDKEKNTTNPELTTLPSKEDIVPSTSDSGTPVKFSNSDIARLTNMLEVPYLYVESFENSQHLPISVATHVACWMAQQDGINSETFAANDIVIDLFCYFAQTVVNFKQECNNHQNDENAAPILFNTSNDTFSVKPASDSGFEEQTHSIQIESVEFLGNNNYYKINATVKAKNKSGCKYKNVVAVIQKNKLDPDLGFSIKALKWS